MLMELNGVDYLYPGPSESPTVLQQVNLQVYAGDFLAVIGASGAGKSTLLALMKGLVRPNKGRVLFKGQDINAKGYIGGKMYKSVGMLFQYPENNFFGYTVYEDVAFGPKNLGKKGAAVDQAVAQALWRVGVPQDFRERSPFSLSGGEKRRVALAGILAMEPEVLLLDEPTAGLDNENRDRFLSLMRELHGQGVTVIMVTHEMEQVCELASKVAVLSHGKLAAYGSTREIMTCHSLRDWGLEQTDVVKLGDALSLSYCGNPVLTEVEAVESILKKRGGRSAC